ncbi:fructose bisphosphate aldolase [Psychromonas sp. L1A2]|uniref:fructose bisphosphate aldolase n=1 Tax=Psychromonas sp. L1A2 TaxID=2686356 RepID=UPI001358C9D6|nr:fructose bisphosphate aldolase [Psychromonas sp. L1A2]
MNKKQLERMRTGKGFIAALDQSGGSTPKALKGYGIEESEYHSEEEMYDLVQAMRSRIIQSQSFTSEHILAAILFEKTMDRKIEGLYTGDYLWDKKGIVPILKVDKGLAEQKDGVQLMKPMPDLDRLLERAKDRNIFGTKMRSVIHEANAASIKKIVEQQIQVGTQIAAAGLVPILEPEVDIHSSSKKEAEIMLIAEIEKQLSQLDNSVKIMLKVSIPTVSGVYSTLMNDAHIVRIVALSGGYSRQEANTLLAKNPNLIASFSRALLSDLSAKQTPAEFDKLLATAINEIYKASV